MIKKTLLAALLLLASTFEVQAVTGEDKMKIIGLDSEDIAVLATISEVGMCYMAAESFTDLNAEDRKKLKARSNIWGQAMMYLVEKHDAESVLKRSKDSAALMEKLGMLPPDTVDEQRVDKLMDAYIESGRLVAVCINELPASVRGANSYFRKWHRIVKKMLKVDQSDPDAFAAQSIAIMIDSDTVIGDFVTLYEATK